MTLEALISGHKIFQDIYQEERPDWDRLVQEGQRPKVLWIGCADSRVTPEHITSTRPGAMLVMRNVANIVPPYGTTGDASSAILEFAIQEIGVEHIIVCGHTHCGGVKAVLSSESRNTSSPISRWVSWILPAMSQVEATGIAVEDRYLETIKANVLLQCENVKSYPQVRDALRSGKLQVYAWLFDLESGRLSEFDGTSSEWRDISSL